MIQYIKTLFETENFNWRFQSLQDDYKEEK